MAAKTGKSARAKARANALGGANPVGRPRTTVEDLPEGWKDIMMAEAQEGGSATGIMVKLGIGHWAFNTLLEDSPEFQSTYEACLLLSKYWWENQGKRMVQGGDGSAPVYALHMTNRFNWRSGRNEVVGDPSAPLQHNVNKQPLSKEELMAELQARGLPTSIFKDE